MQTHSLYSTYRMFGWKRVWSVWIFLVKDLLITAVQKKTVYLKTLFFFPLLALLPFSLSVVSIVFHIYILALPGPSLSPSPLVFLLSTLCNGAQCFPTGWGEGMSKIDVAKWSYSDLSGCENIGWDRAALGYSHAETAIWRLNRWTENRGLDDEKNTNCDRIIVAFVCELQTHGGGNYFGGKLLSSMKSLMGCLNANNINVTINTDGVD